MASVILFQYIDLTNYFKGFRVLRTILIERKELMAKK